MSRPSGHVREGGRLHEELARDLGCTGQTIRNWLKQADLNAGRRHDGPTTAERDELRRLRAEDRAPSAWSGTSMRSGVDAALEAGAERFESHAIAETLQAYLFTARRREAGAPPTGPRRPNL